MSRLLRVELARFRSRRAIALLVLLAFALVALVAAKSAWDTRPPSERELATAEARAEIAANRSDIRADIATCLADPERYLGTNATAQDCRDNLAAAPQSYLPREPLEISGTLQGNGLGVAVLVTGLLVIAASIFAGSDWASGSIVTQLGFEPRRGRMWLAKGGAVALGTGVVALLTIGGFWLTMYAVAAARDVETSAAVTGDVGWHVLRAVVLGMAAALGAFALTMVFRHSVVTLALLFAYSVGGEILAFLVPVDGIGRWTLGNNVFGWLEPHMEFFDPTARCAREGICAGLEHISHLESGAYLAALLVVAVVTSVLVFRRRDV